eukprot:6490841-Amphidinium_carterae.1
MESQSVAPTVSLIRSHGKVAIGCREQSFAQWAVYAMAGEYVLMERVSDFVAAKRGGSILLSFSADSTPLAARGSMSVGDASKRLRATGKSTYDLLVQHITVSAVGADDRIESVTSFACPTIIGYGKSMEALSSLFASCNNIGGVMTCAQEITIRHQVHDAGISHGQRDQVSGWWFTNCVKPIIDSESNEHEDFTELMTLWEWHVSIDCALHATHNSLRWALPELYIEKEVINEAYVCMMSGKQCYLGIIECMDSWLSEVLCACTPAELPNAADLQEMWVMLGCDPETVELLVGMRVVFRMTDQRLLVSLDVIERDSFMADISRALLACWKLDAYTESRWLTLGKAGRSYMRAHLVGFASIMEHAKEKKTVTQYQSGGYDRKSSKVGLLFALLGFVASIPETMMAWLLRDNRLPLYVDKANSDMFAEFTRIADLGDFVWESMASVVAEEVDILKGMVIRASHRALAFVHDKVVVKASSRPWTLTHGDINGKLRGIMEIEEQELDPITIKIRALMHKGYSIDKLRKGCILLGQCSWTSYMSEKLHSSCAVLRRHHPDLGIQSLQVRAFAHSFNQFVPRPTREEVQIKRLVRQKEVALAKQIGRITGRHMYFAQKTKEMARANRNKSKQSQPMKADRVMKIAADHWRQHSGKTQDRYNVEAAAKRAMKERELEEKYEDITGRLTALSQRMVDDEQKDDTSSTMVFSKAAFTEKDIVRFQEIYDLYTSNVKSVMKKTTAQLDKIKPITTESLHTLQSVTMLRHENIKTEYTDLAKSIIRLREFFAEAVFVIEPYGAAECFSFVLATQRPYRLLMRELHAMEVPAPPVAKSWTDWSRAVSAEKTYCWTHASKDICTRDVFAGTSAEHVAVIMRTVYVAVDRLESREEAQPLTQVLEALRMEIKPQGTSTSKPATGARERHQAVDVQRPWLQQLNAEMAKRKRGRTATMDNEDGAGSGSEEREDMENEDMWYDHAHIVEAVTAARSAYEQKREVRLRMFKISLLGGQWQMQRTGRTVYGLRCDVVRNSVVDLLATAWGLHKSASFEHNVYTQSGAETLVDAWMERMEWIATVWDEHGRPTKYFPSKASDTQGYSGELADRIRGLSARSRSRLAQFTSIWPCCEEPVERASSSTGAGT